MTIGRIPTNGFDCFRRQYIAEMLFNSAEVMPERKRRAFRKFLKSLPVGTVPPEGDA